MRKIVVSYSIRSARRKPLNYPSFSDLKRELPKPRTTKIRKRFGAR